MIEAQIFYSKLQAISREMGENLQRISRSPLIAQDRAFATALLTNELELAVQHQYEVNHLFALKESVKELFDYFSFDIAEGDVLLVADPYHGGTQGQTVTMAAPIFLEGELTVFPVVRAQMMDMAGEYPGGYHPDAFELWQESIRLTPVKLFKRGVQQRDVLRFLFANSRSPRLLESDLKAMHACLRTAEAHIKFLLGNHKRQQIAMWLQDIFQYSEQQVKQYIERFPEGSFQSKVSFEDEEQKAVSIHVKATREQGKWVFDFSGTSSQVRSPLNSPFTSTCAFATWPLFMSMSNEIAINDGTLAPFQFHVPQGSVLSPAFPAATAFSGKITGHFISKAVVKALRNGGVPEEMCPSVHGLGPQAILFPPFGQQRETQPIFLAPGFPPSASDWGPPDLFGERLLVSAEELEFYQGFQISSREYDDEQRTGMTVGFTNKKADLYVNLLLPAQKGTDYGSVEFHGKHDEVFNKSTAEELLNLGDRMIFHYSEKAREDS